MKQRRTKLRRILIRTLLFLLLFFGTIGVLSRSKTVQTYLAQEGAQWLSKELGVVVRIKSIEFDFFRSIHLEGLYIEDQIGDTLISVNAVNLEFLKYNKIIRLIRFGKANISGAVINIGFHKGSDSKNLEFLIDYLQGPPRPNGTPKKLWTIQFAEAVLSDCKFYIFDEEKWSTEPGLLDEANLKFSKINGRVTDLRIIDDSFHFQAHDLKAVERSGLTIRRMNAWCNMHDKGMDFTSLDLYTACSHLEGELHWTYPGYKYMDEFISNTTWRADLTHSDLCLSEMSVFSEDLKGHPEVLKINKVKIGGTFDHLKLFGADVEMGEDTRIQGDFYLEGLPDWRTTYCDFVVKYARTNARDIERLVQNTELPEMLHEAGILKANGLFKGQFLDFKWTGNIESGLGNLTTDVLMNFKKGFRNTIFSGNLASNSLDLSYINSNLGISSFDISVDGSGMDADNFKLTANAKIPQFVLFGRSYNDATVTGDLTSKNFSGKAKINDLRINADFEGDVNFMGKQPRFDFVASSRGLDLYELGLDTVHTLIWGKTKVLFTGIEPDKIEGYADISELYIHRKGEVYEFRNQHIEKYGNIENTRMKFYGDFLTGEVSGNVSLNNIIPLAINSMADIFPDKIARQKYFGKDSFQFNMEFHNPELLYGIFYPGLISDPIKINGNFNGKQGLAFAELEPMNIELGAYKLYNFEIHTNREADSTLHFNASALSFYNEGTMQLQNMALLGRAKNNSAEYNIKLADKTGNYSIDVSAISKILKDSITLQFMESSLKMDEGIWEIDRRSNLVFLNDGTIKCPWLYLDGDAHYIEAKGTISNRITDTLNLDLGNFSFDFVRPYLKQSFLDSLDGRLNGNIQVAALLGWPRFSGEINARDLEFYSVRYGDADIQLMDLDKSGRLQLKADFFDGVLGGIAVNGNIGYRKIAGMEQLNVLIDIPENSNLAIIQPFLIDVLTIKGGKIEGQININGDFDKPKISGEIKATQVETFIDYLKTGFKFDAEFIANSKGIFTKAPALMHDENYTGTALASIAITHRDFDNFYIDVKIDSARNLKCLNTKEGDDDIFYGTAYADGYCHIWGPFDKISMDINLKSRKNSNVKVLYSDLEENELLGYIRFVKRVDNKKDSIPKEASSVIHRININLDINTDMEAEFIIDKRLGDAIKGRGKGKLRMLYDENENFYLYGIYRVEQGDYVFSIPGINLVTKKIRLEQGGSIIWSGDPYNALINMTGAFEKKISPAALMTAVSGGSQKSYAPIRVQSKLFLNGNLMSPDIGFDIQAPDLESSGSGANGDVYRVIQRIRLDKDETMKQAVALLLFGNFVTPSFAQNSATSSGIVSGTGVAGNSLSSLASSVVNDIFSQAGIPTRIQVNIDDVRDNSGGQAAKVFVNTEWFLTDRVRLDVNFDPTVAVLVNNVALPFNFNLEYMTRNENWRIKAFSRSSNLLTQQSSTTLSTGVSGNTLGAGVVYRREFDTFRRKKAAQSASSN